MTRRRSPRISIRRSGTLTYFNACGPVTLATTVLDMSGGGVGLRLSVPVAPGTPIELQLDDGVRLGGVVRHSTARADHQYNVGVEQPGASRILDRRKEARFDSEGDACIAAIAADTAQPEFTQTAAIFDVSKCGLGLIAGQALSPGRTVEITFNATRVTGVVRNCRPVVDGYRIGISLGDCGCERASVRPRTQIPQALGMGLPALGVFTAQVM